MLLAESNTTISNSLKVNCSTEAGGDFYDFFMSGENALGIVVADMSGKGVPATLLSMIAKTMLKTQMQTGLSPDRVLAEVNASLSEHNDEDMFVTVWPGVLEIFTGKLTYADAGHEKTNPQNRLRSYPICSASGRCRMIVAVCARVS